jgi:hypothetical protein
MILKTYFDSGDSSREYTPQRRCRITSLAAGRRAAAYNAQRQQERAEAAARGVAPPPIVLPAMAYTLAPEQFDSYLDSDVEGDTPLIPYMPQSAMLSKLKRMAQNAAFAVCFAVLPLAAVAANVWRTANDVQVVRESRITQNHSPQLIPATAVVDYVPPVVFTKGESWTSQSKNSKTRALPQVKNFALPKTRHTPNTTPRLPPALRSKTSREKKRNGWRGSKMRYIGAIADCATKATHSAKSHRSARSVRHAAQQRHHKRLHQSTEARILHAVPAVRLAALFVAHKCFGE